MFKKLKSNFFLKKFIIEHEELKIRINFYFVQFLTKKFLILINRYYFRGEDKMKKINPLIVIGFFIFNGFEFFSGNEFIKEKCKIEKISFSQPNIIDKGKNSLIKLAEISRYPWEIGKPMLPVFKNISAFPFGTQVNNVKVTFSDYFEKDNLKQIRPAPESEISYEKIVGYPEQRFTYIIGMGLKGKEHIIYLLIYLCPVNYHPKNNFIYCFGS